jgi:hypothetical protein
MEKAYFSFCDFLIDFLIFLLYTAVFRYSDTLGTERSNFEPSSSRFRFCALNKYIYIKRNNVFQRKVPESRPVIYLLYNGK